MNQLHIKNHYVPECYLKSWVNNDKKVHVYSTLVAHSKAPLWKALSVSSIAYQKHLYTQIQSGKESDEIESWLDQKFEFPASSVLNKVTSENKLSIEDWKILINFLAAQDVRTPARLQEHLQRAEKDYSETLQSVMNELEKKQNLDDVKALIENEEKHSSSNSIPLKITTYIEEGSDTAYVQAESYIGRATWIHSIKHILENTKKILHSHKWSIVKPAKGYYWPTSDNPVVKLNYYKDGSYDLKGGWGVEHGNIFFPIGPEHAMFLEIGHKPIEKNTRLSIELTQQLIKFVAENAHRKIFSHKESVLLPKLRKRLVAPSVISQEKKQILNWHQQNSILERNYLASNKTPTHRK